MIQRPLLFSSRRGLAAAAFGVILLLAAPAFAAPPGGPAIGATPDLSRDSSADAREIDWLELLPPEDLKALQEMPEIDHAGEMIMPEVMQSTRTVAAMAGTIGKLPGYLVPIAFDDQQRVTEMFLVPYFGACIHVPPPPPNQLVFIKPENPIELGNLWDAYWVHGMIETDITDNAMAKSAYTMRLDRLELIEE